MNKTFLAATATLALALAFAGCGDEEDPAEPATGPASVVPADMPVYLEATVRPDGEQAENLDALLSDLGELPLIGSVGDPRELLLSQLESEAAAAGVDFSYEDDVEPWLGEKAGVGIDETETGETSFVAAVETTDEEAARESIDNLLSGDSVPYEESEYEGVTYLAAPGDEYRLGVFDGHVVMAPPTDFEEAVDASGGESLGSSEILADTLASLDEERLASVFVDLSQFEKFASTPEDAEEFETFQAALPEFFESGIALSMGLSDSDQVYVDYSTPFVEGLPESGASPLLDSAPGDSLGAVAFSDIGAFGQPIVDLFEEVQEEGADLDDFPAEGIEQAFEDEVGVPFDDATAAIGDASVWLRGDLPDGIEIGGEIEVTDTEIATDLIESIEREIESEGSAKVGPPVGGGDVGFSALQPETVGGPIECSSVGDTPECIPSTGTSADLPFVNIELDGDVVRYGFFRDEKAAAASDPDAGGDFADTETYATGEEAVGDDFEFVGAVDLTPILDEFVPSPGVGDAILGGSPEELIGPYIASKLDVVAFGQKYDGDYSVTRYVLKLAE